MLKAVSLFLLLSVSLLAQGTYTYSYVGAPLFIYTDSANVVTVGSIMVDRAFTLQKVTVSVNVAYSPVGDINLYLFSPDGTRTKLVERNCGSQGTLVNISFDDTAASRYSDFCPSEAGRGPFRGNEPLSNFNGKSSAGIWRLAVENNGSDRTGWMNGWSITIVGGSSTAPTMVDVVNRSSLKTGPIAPNSAVLAYGENLGPTTVTFAPTGQTLPTTLAGTQVLLNGNPIPIKGVYASAIEAVIPADVLVGSKPTIQAVVNGVRGNVGTYTVQASVPGLYSQGVLGDTTSGSWAIVKAVDQNFKVITSTNPAVQGSIVTLYASGLGATTPPLAAGAVPGSSQLYVVNAQTFAAIGGVGAPVLFAGLAPGYPGVYQINVRVPTGLTAGLQPILIWSGGGVSQDGLSIPVK